MKKFLYAFHCMSIRRKLIISFTALVIVPVVSSLIFSYSILNRILLEKISNANVDALIRTSKRIDGLLNDMSHTLINISSNSDLRDIFRNDDGKPDYEYNYINQKKLENIFDRIPLSMLGFSYITAIDIDGTSYANWEGFHRYLQTMKASNWYKELVGSYSESILWIGANMVINKPSLGDIYMIEAGVPIKGYTQSLNNIGTLHIAIPETYFYDILKSDNQLENIFLIDNSGKIISCSDKKMIGNTIKWYDEIVKSSSLNGNWFTTSDRGDGRMVITFSDLNKAGWKIVSVIQNDKMTAPINSTRDFFLIINLLFILSFVIVAIIVSNSISKPLIDLTRRIKNVERGDFSQKAEIVYEDEIGNLSRNFNNMMDKVNELMELTKLKEKQKREAELEALQAQINPHFLFNTLSSIRWAAAASGNDKVEDMVLALSNLLKISINKGPDMIPMNEEIRVLKCYVDLCKMRQGNDFNLECNLPSEILELKIPRLLLQPIVENSIIHGFQDRKIGGVIKIYGFVKDGTARIFIEDNGSGIDQEIMGEVEKDSEVRSSSGKLFKGIGIKNVNERIKLNYGDNYGLWLESSKNGGTLVTILIPMTEGEENNAHGNVG